MEVSFSCGHPKRMNVNMHGHWELDRIALNRVTRVTQQGYHWSVFLLREGEYYHVSKSGQKD